MKPANPPDCAIWEGFLLLPWLERVFVTFALIVRDWSWECFRRWKSASLPYMGAELVQSQDVSVNVSPFISFQRRVILELF